MNQTICNAMANLRLIEFTYKDETQARIAEPHCHGNTTKGNEVVRAYQVGGYSNNPIPEWRLFSVNEMKNLHILDGTFTARAEYRRGDKQIPEICCEL
jgi:hypothetical protein